MKFLASIFAPFAALVFLAACSDSDQYLYDEEDSVALQIHAEMTRTYEIESAESLDDQYPCIDNCTPQVKPSRVRADTVTSKDTLIFIGEITPNRQAHYREYYWTLDGEDFSNDMNFRKPVTKPGYHEICFVVTDHYGDTLRDTLRLWVSNPPVLETQGFIPAIRSQGLSPKEGITFAWHGYDPDSISKVYYKFEIQEPRGIRYTDDRHPKLYTVSHSILDTLIDTPHFTYWDNPNYYHRLENLKFYTWSVRAVNEFGLESDSLIQGDFFTKGNKNEGGIQTFIRFSNESLYDRYYSSNHGKIHLDILDSLSNPVVEHEIGLDTNQFVVSPLKPGKYKIIANLPKLTDFSPDTADVVVHPGEIAIADTLRLLDTIPPSNKHLSPEGLLQDLDTLDFLDTLRFYFEEHGGGVYQNFFWNGQELRGSSFFREISYNEDRTADTVFLVLPKTYKSWTYQLLSISAYDYSGNLNSKTYVIRPSLERPEPESSSSSAENSSSAGGKDD